MPKDIINSVIDGKLTIFAGAGVSSENEIVLPYSFYDSILIEFENPETLKKLSFPQLMTKYEKTFGRKKLIEKILSRFDFIESFPELYERATKFHNELRTVSYIKNIFTTNWDTYFENECGAVPFVSSEDFVFYDIPKRKVIKIHG
jgi:hypothetical protein